MLSILHKKALERFHYKITKILHIHVKNISYLMISSANKSSRQNIV